MFFRQPGDLRDQLRRAALSASNNVAEGFERGSTTELVAFLYIARVSAGEVRSMLHFVVRNPDAAHLKAQIAALTAQSESCSRQMRAWAGQLQNSDIKGQRNLTDKSRRQCENQRATEAFKRELNEIVRRGREEKEQKEDGAL